MKFFNIILEEIQEEKVNKPEFTYSNFNDELFVKYF